jgi:hypothetical protein
LFCHNLQLLSHLNLQLTVVPCELACPPQKACDAHNFSGRHV